MRLNFNGVIGEVDSLPGCTQIAVSHSVFVDEKIRNNGLGTFAMRNRLYSLKVDFGYDYVLCTVNLENEPQIKLLNKFGWEYLSQFTSSKTGNIVQIFGKKL